MYIIVIAIFIIIILLVIVFYNRDNFISNEAYVKNLYTDDMYTDVIQFRNGGGMLGIDRCIALGQLTGKGICSEYGQTGVAYFYPFKSPFTQSEHQRIKGIEYNLEDIDRAFHYLVYPNM